MEAEPVPPEVQPGHELQREFAPVSVATLVAQVLYIQQIMAAVMKDGEHYGVIPGTKKKSLYKAGAEKLAFVFRHRPEFEVETLEVGVIGHREVRVRCRLYNVRTGDVVGEGVGSCSTLESKYRYRYAEKECPECGKPCIRRSRFLDDDGDRGWYCFDKAGGCGSQFHSSDERITEQVVGKVDNPDVADVYNTVLKMAKKRALVDAEITACAASDLFVQDLGDDPEEPEPGTGNSATAAAAKPKPAPKPEPRRRSEPPPADRKPQSEAEERLAQAAPETNYTKGKVSVVTYKPTANGGKRFTVTLIPSEGGPPLVAHTFDETRATAAREFAGSKLPCVVEWQPTPRYGNDLLGILLANIEGEDGGEDLPF